MTSITCTMIGMDPRFKFEDVGRVVVTTGFGECGIGSSGWGFLHTVREMHDLTVPRANVGVVVVAWRCRHSQPLRNEEEEE